MYGSTCRHTCGECVPAEFPKLSEIGNERRWWTTMCVCKFGRSCGVWRCIAFACTRPHLVYNNGKIKLKAYPKRYPINSRRNEISPSTTADVYASAYFCNMSFSQLCRPCFQYFEDPSGNQGIKIYERGE